MRLIYVIRAGMEPFWRKETKLSASNVAINEVNDGIP
jgi:hypothetical protein